jgi:hypothetical protein
MDNLDKKAEMIIIRTLLTILSANNIRLARKWDTHDRKMANAKRTGSFLILSYIFDFHSDDIFSAGPDWTLAEMMKETIWS